MTTAAGMLGLATLVAVLCGLPRTKPAATRVLLGLGFLVLLACVAHGGPVAAVRRILAALPLVPVVALYLGLLSAALLLRIGAADALLRAFGPGGRPPVEGLALASLLPLVLSLPCGHALGASGLATSPWNGGPLGLAFVRTAYGSCAPASAGGITRMAEAWSAGGTEALRAAQVFALMIAAGATAMYARALLPAGPAVSPAGTAEGKPGALAWAALAIHLAALVAAAHAGIERIEPIVWLAVGAGALALLAALGGGIAPSAALAAVPAAPVVDLLLGLSLAAAGEAAGAFEVAAGALSVVASWGFPGPEGVLLLLGIAPLLVPLACGRVAAAALIPFAGALGPHGAGVWTAPQTAVCLAVLTLCAAMSCVVSPAGGCLARLGDPRSAAARAALDLAALCTAVPLTAAWLRWRAEPAWVLFAGALVVGANRATLAVLPRRRLAFAGSAALASALTAAWAGDAGLAAALRGAGVGALAGWALAEART